MLNRYVEQILGIYNYIDGLVVANQKGILECFITYRPDINQLKEEDVVGKHVLEVYPELREETSSIMRALRDGKPIFNEFQHLTTYKGGSIYAVNTTLPIVSGEKIIGAVDVSRYLDPKAQRQNITLPIKDNSGTKAKNELYSLSDIIAEDPAMLEVKEKIRKVARTNTSVLIYGGTGTGKELVAQSIHRHSGRNSMPFVSQNCAAIPATLLESILFGTVKGSYTGAENRKGLFEVAHKGTLFLDEVSTMEISIQAKILKAIEEKRIRRVGGTEPIDIDVRIISAANEDPREAIKAKRLREDLFYRLSALQIKVPDLKDRKGDIPLLTEHFIKEFNRQMCRNIKGVSQKVEEVFRQYSWPGNVRELKNVIEGAFNLSPGDLIQVKDLPEFLAGEKKYEKDIDELLGKLSLPQMTEEFEVKVIRAAQGKTDNMAQAAKLLGISKQLLKYKMDKYNL